MTTQEFQSFDWRKTEKVVFRGKTYKVCMIDKINCRVLVDVGEKRRWVDCEAIEPEPEEQPIVIWGAVVFIK